MAASSATRSNDAKGEALLLSLLVMGEKDAHFFPN
jgi:hypothetical protein